MADADITSDENGDTWFIYDPLVTPLQPGAEDPHKVNTAANSPAVTEMKEVEENNKENTVVKAAEVIQRKAASEEESAAQVTAAKDAGVAISELAKAKSNELQARKEVEAAHEAEVQAIALKNKKDQESTQATAEAMCTLQNASTPQFSSGLQYMHPTRPSFALCLRCACYYFGTIFFTN